MMNTPVLLRIAAALAFVQFCAHTTMFVTYAPMHGAEETSVVQAMQSHFFSFSGWSRSYWDLYFGYGLFSAFNCLIEAVLFFQLASIAGKNPRIVRMIAGLFLVANIGYATLIYRYFFPLPGYFDIAIALLLGAVIFTASKSPNRKAKDHTSGLNNSFA